VLWSLCQPNRYVFNARRNCWRVRTDCRRLDGRLFHSLGSLWGQLWALVVERTCAPPEYTLKNPSLRTFWTSHCNEDTATKYASLFCVVDVDTRSDHHRVAVRDRARSQWTDRNAVALHRTASNRAYHYSGRTRPVPRRSRLRREELVHRALVSTRVHT